MGPELLSRRPDREGDTGKGCELLTPGISRKSLNPGPEQARLPARPGLRLPGGDTRMVPGCLHSGRPHRTGTHVLHVLHGDFRQLLEEVPVPPTAGRRPQAHGSLIQRQAMPRPHLGVSQPFCDALDRLQRTGSRKGGGGRCQRLNLCYSERSSNLSTASPPGPGGRQVLSAAILAKAPRPPPGEKTAPARRSRPRGASPGGGRENTPCCFQAQGQSFRPMSP